MSEQHHALRPYLLFHDVGDYALETKYLHRRHRIVQCCTCISVLGFKVVEVAHANEVVTESKEPGLFRKIMAIDFSAINDKAVSW